MKIKFLLSVSVLLALSFNALAESSGAEMGALKLTGGGQVSFKADVQPIIHDYCLNCHIPGGKGYVKSGLDMSTYESLMKGTKYGAVVKPGDSETSTFTKLLTGTNRGLKMPAGLNASGTLDRQYILTLRKWVQQGAKNN